MHLSRDGESKGNFVFIDRRGVSDKEIEEKLKVLDDPMGVAFYNFYTTTQTVADFASTKFTPFTRSILPGKPENKCGNQTRQGDTDSVRCAERDWI